MPNVILISTGLWLCYKSINLERKQQQTMFDDVLTSKSLMPCKVEAMIKTSMMICYTRQTSYHRLQNLHYKIDFEAPASTWTPLPPRWLAVTTTLTFEYLQNLIESLVGTGKKNPCKFHWDCSGCSWDIVVTTNKLCEDKQTDKPMNGRTECCRWIARKYGAFTEIDG